MERRMTGVSLLGRVLWALLFMPIQSMLWFLARTVFLLLGLSWGIAATVGWIAGHVIFVVALFALAMGGLAMMAMWRRMA